MLDLFKVLFDAVTVPFFLVLCLVIMYAFFGYFDFFDPASAISALIFLSPIWLPVSLFYLTFKAWMSFVQTKFALDNGRTTLRLLLPQEVFKSPEAMESVLAQIYNPGYPDNLMQSYLDGKHALTFSFELVSIGGEVRFYVNVPVKKTKNSIEAQLYAHYPGIEIVEELADYTDEISWNPDKYEMMAFRMAKKGDDIYPIKTYIDFGLDRMPKEEEKFEPMAAMLEQLSRVKPHERVWIQILATPHFARSFKNGYLKDKPTWEGRVQAKVNEMLKRDAKRAQVDDDGEKNPLLTVGEKDMISSMERNSSKYAYETAIRWLYITEKGKFDGDGIGPLIRTFSQYDVLGRNGIGVRWRTDFDYNFISDRSGKKKEQYKKEELKSYKLREYSTRDKAKSVDGPKVMSVEELATIYHIPGSVIVTPSLPRITSTKREAPSNLPTGRQVQL